jgi:hypothetical protein
VGKSLIIVCGVIGGLLIAVVVFIISNIPPTAYKTDFHGLFFSIVSAKLIASLYLIPLFIALGAIIKAFVRIQKIVLILTLFIFIALISLNSYLTYRNWQSFIEVYRYPNTSNIQITKTAYSFPDVPSNETIEFKTADSLNIVYNFYVNNIPANYSIFQQTLKADYASVGYVTPNHAVVGPEMHISASGGTIISITKLE